MRISPMHAVPNLLDFKHRILRFYRSYVDDYKLYLLKRGYEGHVHDWHFFKRAFLECWMEPGFYRFWQQWNPGLGYFTFKFYIWLGGKIRPRIARMIVFVTNGFFHNLIVSLLLARWDFPLPFTFLSFWAFSELSRWVDKYFRFKALPPVLNIGFNLGMVLASFRFGFVMNALIMGWLHKLCLEHQSI